MALFEGDCAAARSSFSDSLSTSARLGDRTAIAVGLEGMAGVFTRDGQVERAARLLGAAGALRKAIDASIEPVDLAEYERTVQAARTTLGEAAFSTAWTEGEGMTMEQATRLARAEKPASAEMATEKENTSEHTPA